MYKIQGNLCSIFLRVGLSFFRAGSGRGLSILYIKEKFSVQFPYHLDIISMSSEWPLKFKCLIFCSGWGRGIGGRLCWLFHVLICNRNKNKAHYLNLSIKFLQIQRLEAEIISLLFVSESGTLIEKLGLISTLMCRLRRTFRGVWWNCTMTLLKLWMWTRILIQMPTPFEFDMIEEFQEIK